jgi:hypothetical protein
MQQTYDSLYFGTHFCPSLSDEPLRVAQLVRPMKGRSRSWLVYGFDDELYVMKFNGHVHNRNLLANEAIGAYLLHGLGIPVPKCRQLLVDQFLLDNTNMESTLDNVVPLEGTHFGSIYMGTRDAVARMEPWDFVAASDALWDDHIALGVYMFDLWSNNLDPRQVLHMVRRRVAMGTVFIDNSDIFSGASWSFDATRIGPAFQLAQHRSRRDPKAIDEWCHRFRTVIPPLLEEVIETIPESWYTGDIRVLSRSLNMRLDDLHNLVQRAVWAN